MKSTEKCTNVYSENFVAGTVPAACDKHQTIRICNTSNLVANEYCEDVREEVFTLKSDAEANGSSRWTTSYGDAFNYPTEVCTHTPHDFTYED